MSEWPLVPKFRSAPGMKARRARAAPPRAGGFAMCRASGWARSRRHPPWIENPRSGSLLVSPLPPLASLAARGQKGLCSRDVAGGRLPTALGRALGAPVTGSAGDWKQRSGLRRLFVVGICAQSHPEPLTATLQSDHTGFRRLGCPSVVCSPRVGPAARSEAGERLSWLRDEGSGSRRVPWGPV